MAVSVVACSRRQVLVLPRAVAGWVVSPSPVDRGGRGSGRDWGSPGPALTRPGDAAPLPQPLPRRAPCQPVPARCRPCFTTVRAADPGYPSHRWLSQRAPPEHAATVAVCLAAGAPGASEIDAVGDMCQCDRLSRGRAEARSRCTSREDGRAEKPRVRVANGARRMAQ